MGLVPPGESAPCDRDGYITLELRHKRDLCLFKKNPTAFITEFLTLRRKGQDFSLTPAGRLLRGRLVTEQDLSRR